MKDMGFVFFNYDYLSRNVEDIRERAPPCNALN